MSSFLILLVVGVLYLFRKGYASYSVSHLDKFKYLWTAEDLALIYESLVKKFPEKKSEIISLHNQQVRRIKTCKTNAENNLRMILLEAEHVMKSRRSLAILKEKATMYAKKLAVNCGYDKDEILADGFDCIGWSDLWALFQKHKKRILGTVDEASSNDEKDVKKITLKELRERFRRIATVDELHQERIRLLGKNSKNDDAYRLIEESFHEALLLLRTRENSEKESTTQRTKETVKDKNEKIFDNIFTTNELKQKYRKLCKRNHPDVGGSEAAMKKLNQLYNEALERITNSTKADSGSYSENTKSNY